MKNLTLTWIFFCSIVCLLGRCSVVQLRIPTFGLKAPFTHNQRSPAKKTKIGAAIDKYIVPVIDKITPDVAKPHLATAGRYLEKNWVAVKNDWAACRKLYATARTPYEKIDKVIKILQMHKKEIIIFSAVTYVGVRLEELWDIRRDAIKLAEGHRKEMAKWGSRVELKP